MKNKIIAVISIAFLSLFMFSCDMITYIKNEKPSNSYYFSILNNIVNNEDYEIQVLDTNVYREITVADEDIRIIPDLIKNLKQDNFLDEKPIDLPEKPLYKLFIVSSNDKMVLDVYGADIIALYPWDGLFDKDYLTLKTVPNAFKMEQFCKYVFDK